MYDNILEKNEIEYLEGDELVKHQRLFGTYKKGAIRIHPQHCFLPISFMKGAQIVHEIEPREDDVYIVTFPKSGTTWMQEIVWTMRNSPDLDHPQARLGIFVRCPFIESDYLGESEDWLPFLKNDCTLVQEFLEMCPNGDYTQPISIQLADCSPHPRTLKSHLPLSLLNPKILQQSKIAPYPYPHVRYMVCRPNRGEHISPHEFGKWELPRFLELNSVVYVARNPKDVCVSYFHHHRLFAEVEYKGTIEEFVDLFISGDLMYGAYDKHIGEVWKLKDADNIHIVFYEDLKKDAEKEIRRLDAFLGTHLSDKQIDNILHYTSFSEMKKRDSAFVSNDLKSNLQFFVKAVVEKDGGFYRKGEVGDFKNRLTPDLEAKLDNWIEDSFTKLGIEFSYHARN